MSTAPLVPAAGSVMPAEIKKLDTYLSGRQFDTLGEAEFAAKYEAAVRDLAKAQEELETARKFRPDYAPGPTATERTLEDSISRRTDLVRYFQIRYWLARKNISIDNYRRR